MSEPARANVKGDRNIVVQAIGSGIDVTINSGVPHLSLTQFRARTKRADDGSDAALLSAWRTDVVPLLGRKHALDDLRRWLASGRDISIRVLTGGAGRGKTRLALELVREAAGKEWLAGFATPRELDRFRTQQNVAEWAWDKPVLIVVDYAAGRVDQLRDWIGELADAPEGRPPLRLLLLERQAQRDVGWLASVLAQGSKDGSRAAVSLLDPPDPVELDAIEGLPLRRQIFASLLARKRDDLIPPDIGVDRGFDRLLQHEKWSGDPLFLMMAGLVAGSHGINDALSLNRTDLAAIVAEWELDRIDKIASGAARDPGTKQNASLLARHAAVLATLCQGLTLADARALIETEAGRLNSNAGINTAVAALQDALPAGDGLDIAPILPDIIGEAAIMYWLGNGGASQKSGIDPLSSIRRGAATALERASLTLVRTAQDFAAAGRDEPVRWLYAIAQAAQTDLGALMTIANALPNQTLALLELAAELSQLIVDRLRSDVREGRAAEAVLGRWLANLGLQLGNLGRREEALAASQEAVDISRRLAETHSEILPDLAKIPNGAHVFLSSATIYRRLVAQDADLASSLNQLGNHLSDLGRREEALAATQEAVAIYRRLAEIHPDAFLRKLASSLHNFGNRLSDLGRREEALAANQEAVANYRRLAETRPTAFVPELAKSLTSLSVRLADLDRREEALTASCEAVAIGRRLAETRPDAFLPDLAGSLNNIGRDLSCLGRREEALAAGQEAAGIYRRLAEIRPGPFLPYLAGSLNNVGIWLSDLGRRGEALAAGQEAIAIRRRLAETHPDAFLPGLATSLGAQGRMYAQAGRYADAVGAFREGLAIIAPFVERNLHAFDDLAGYLSEYYAATCEAVGTAPDAALLERVARAIGK